MASFTEFAADYQKKKKKQAEQNTPSFTAYFSDYGKSKASATEIAPVQTEESTWFKNGKGNVVQDTLGTVGDVGLNIAEGFLGSFEGITDLLLYGAGEIAGIFSEDAEAFLDEAADINTTGRLLGDAEAFVDEYSYLGDKSDAVSNMLGQVGAMYLSGGISKAAGLGKAATTAVTTAHTFASATGSGVSNARNSGATDGEAWGYGAMTGSVEAISELLWGGLGKGLNAIGISKGIGGIDDVVAKKVSGMFASRFAKNLAQLGVKATGEGLEEVAAYYGDALAKKLSYMSEKEWSEIADSDEAWDSFVIGAIGSGVSQSGIVPGMKKGSFIESTKAGRDFVSGLTANEQKVVDKEVENRIKEAKEKGEKVNEGKIREAVEEDLKNGGISIDTIEEVLGGDLDSYKAYKDSIESDNATIKELQELYGDKAVDAEFASRVAEAEQNGQTLTSKQKENLRAEIAAEKQQQFKTEVESIYENSQRGELRKTLNEDLKKMLTRTKGKNTQSDRYLLESYAEVARRGQKFEADVNQYKNENARKTIQNILDAGVANNTRRTHQLANTLAKISADKGIIFTATDAKRLAETSFGVNGKTVNGFYTKDGITINVDSPKYLNSVVGHEISHVFEKNAELYKLLQDAAFAFAKGRKSSNGKFENEYMERLFNARQLYKDVDGYKGTKGHDAIKKEVVADLVGDYLFTDTKFIENLSVKNRNLFLKIFDEIKYLCKIATAGSKEKRDLERVKKAFEDAYRSSTTNAKTDGKTDADGEKKYSLGYHAGDLGKAESLGNQSGGRDTGHYGTGTYFVGDEAEISDSTYGKRPHEKVDFDKYNLYQPKTRENAGRLHDFLKGVNYYYDRDTSLVSSDEEIEAIKEKVDDLRYDELTNDTLEEVINLVSKVAGKSRVSDALWSYLGDVSQGGDGTFYNGDKPMSVREVAETIEDKDSAAYKLEQLLDDGYVLRPIWRFQEWNESISEAAEMLGVSEERVHQIISDIKAEIDAAGYDYNSAYTADSASTRFMKALGYEGVDVRGIKGYDNTAYGSVIYDLKGEDLARKNEIGTAKYSLSLDKYSQKQYNSFGWARDTDAITKNELDDMYSKLHTKRSLKDFPQTYDGEAIIEVNDDPYTLAANNVFVFAKGTKNNPEITRVVRVNFFDEASLDVFRKDIYANSDHRTLEIYAQVMGEETFRYYDRNHSADYRAYKEKSGAQRSGSEGEGNAPVDRNGNQRSGAFAENQQNGINKTSSNDGVFFDAKERKYSLSADSDGRQLSKEQSDYFKDSKVVDENGNLKVMYHGTPNGDFTVFKDGTYFTEHKWYADLYQNPGASSISTGKVASAPKTFEVYLDIKKPFDISDAEARSIYINDYIKGGNAVGINPYLSDAEYDKISSIDWTEGEDLREFLIDNGYDYDGLVLDEGATGGYGEDVKNRGKSYVVFSPEQVKKVDNKNPTSDPDIRFSLSESVEETKDLMALHNLKGDELLKSLDLGGLPMPSLAIIKAEAGHEQYGDISLIFPKETIDPKANKANKVYGGDAWTPTYPRMEYKANEDVAKRIRDKYYALEREYGYDKVRPLYDYVYELENALNRDGGEENLKENLYIDTRMMQVYLLDSGKGEIPTVKKEIRTELTDHEVGMYEFLAQKLGNEVIDGASQTGLGSPFEQRKAYWATNGEAIKEAYGEFLAKEFGFSEEDVQNVLANMKAADFLKVVRDAKMYQTNGRTTIKYENDFDATREAIREAAGEGYKAWVDDLFGGSEAKSGIRNNVDRYTPSGNPRSWDALHWENTLENVVKAMKQQDSTGSEAVFGVHKFFAASSKDYGSIAEIKADADRLHKIDDGDYKAAKDAFESRFSDIATRIMDKTESNRFIAMDNAMECIVDAVRSSKTQDGIYKELSQYRQLNITKQDVADIVSLVNDIANMPTGYFEAKPQRAVSFDEVGVFVIPRNADVKLKQELLNRGYAIAEYDPDVEGDRKKVVNSFEQYKFSLSDVGETPTTYGDYHVRGEDVKYVPMEEDIAPVKAVDNAVDDSVTKPNILPDDAPITEEEANALQGERLSTLTDADAPPEMDAPYYGEEETLTADDPFEDRDIKTVGNRKVKAYMYENPEVRPFFQQEATHLLWELEQTEKPQTYYNGFMKYEMSYEAAQDIPEIYRTKRVTSPDIAYLRDTLKMSYADIEKGLKAIIEDHGAENIAAAKKIEFVLNDRLLKGSVDMDGFQSPPNQDYINLINEKQIAEYSDEARKQFFEVADEYAPAEDDIAPITPDPTDPPTSEWKDTAKAKIEEFAKSQKTDMDADFAPVDEKIAKVLTEEPEVNQKGRTLSKARMLVLDKQSPIEDLALKTKNRELMGKANFMLSSENRAQTFMGKGKDGVRSLTDLRAEVENAGLEQEFSDYMYHKHNVDRMSLESKAQATIAALQGKFGHLETKQIYAIANTEITEKTTERTAQTIREAKDYLNALEAKNKPVFGDSVTAEVSQQAVAEFEKKHPEFKRWAKDVYGINEYLREMLVEAGVVSQETADLWAEMYPNYVPIRRDGKNGAAVNVALDTNRTGVDAPIRRATGGNSDILPMFNTLATRIEQTFRAVARNNFGIELKNTLGVKTTTQKATLDEVMDNFDKHEELLKKGENGANPTFTVFENGERVEFEITEDLYDALKPNMFQGEIKPLSFASKLQRGLLTEYNPVFLATNAIKDVQDVLMNSQHARKTYANMPLAIKELFTKGKWYQEYMENGGGENTYFDNQKKTFTKEDTGLKKLLGLPFRGISAANNFIERMPRLAEYIASRKSGASVEVAMLDAARVTTNFAAGGDLTKWANRNGFTFLNASVQGFNQNVRNIREAKAKGLGGVMTLAAKFAVAGLPAMLLNHLLWEDDEEYEELSDYVKDGYYIVGKTEDGTFIRIPKGRALAVIQSGFEQMGNLITGDDEADMARFGQLLVENLAPNNPLDNNVFAPIKQVAENKTWYGEDLVPQRLQDLPAAEQYDESTDSISKWLGEKLDVSPYKINYLLDQYSGGIGDVFLPMLTPEAENGDSDFFAPMRDKFTTDSVLKNQNVSDFYDTVDELTKNANSSNATDEDVLKSKYMNSVKADISELYKLKREVQNSNLPDDRKHEKVREIQDEINALAKEGLGAYGSVQISNGYAVVGDRQYRLNDKGEWTKISTEQANKQDDVTDELGISASDYWSNKSEYDFAYEYPEKYAVAKSVGGYDAYKTYASELYDIKADKDSNGKTISGSRKKKVYAYINALEADYGTKIILWKSEYKSDNSYNYDIIEYLESREDISYDEMVTILKELGFTVSSDGRVTW